MGCGLAAPLQRLPGHGQLQAGPSLPGAVSETVLVSPPPTTPQVNTQISRQTANVGDTIIDPITVTGSDGFEGALKSRPLGPVAPLGTQLHLRVPVSAGSVLPQPTGSDVRVMALAGLGLVVIGGAAALATRRRKLIAE